MDNLGWENLGLHYGVWVERFKKVTIVRRKVFYQATHLSDLKDVVNYETRICIYQEEEEAITSVQPDEADSTEHQHTD
jgi:hypothetical protein